MEILFVNNKKNKIWNKILFCFFKLNHLKTILQNPNNTDYFLRYLFFFSLKKRKKLSIYLNEIIKLFRG